LMFCSAHVSFLQSSGCTGPPPSGFDGTNGPGPGAPASLLFKLPSVNVESLLEPHAMRTKTVTAETSDARSVLVTECPMVTQSISHVIFGQ